MVDLRKSAHNPYAAPEESCELDLDAVAELLKHQPFVIDGDAILCGRELFLNELCYETGRPAPGEKDFYKKLFAPSPRWSLFFRTVVMLHALTIIQFLLLGWNLRWGRLTFLGIPSFVWFWGYIGLMVWRMQRVPSVRLYLRRSPKGRRLRFLRALPGVAYGIACYAPTWFLMPSIFQYSTVFGVLALALLIILTIPVFFLIQEPQALSLPNGIFRVTGLPTELLNALKMMKSL